MQEILKDIIIPGTAVLGAATGGTITIHEILKDIIIPGIALIGAGVGGAITISTYYRNSQLRRAEWLYSLFDKFFCQSSYADIRWLLDYGDKQALELLEEALAHHTDVQLEEKLVDYLNFFGFIATLWQLRQLTIEEIRMMFNYYISLLGKHAFILKYLEDQQFKGLHTLVQEVIKRKDIK